MSQLESGHPPANQYGFYEVTVFARASDQERIELGCVNVRGPVAQAKDEALSYLWGSKNVLQGHQPEFDIQASEEGVGRPPVPMGAWLKLSEHTPPFMGGYIALLHPDKDEPDLSFIGYYPKDFAEDGYTHFMYLGRLPEEHLKTRKEVKSRARVHRTRPVVMS